MEVLMSYLFVYLWQYWGWAQGLELSRQVLYQLSHTSSPFCFIVFQVESHVFALPCLGSPPNLFLLHSWDYSCEPPCPACLLRWGVVSFLPRLASTCNPPHLCLPNSWDYSHVPSLVLMSYLSSVPYHCWYKDG
jgi:hypothetical protein